MKQDITKEQFNELSGQAQERLLQWVQEKHYDPFLTIGQMIEFLKGKQVYDDFQRPYTFVEIFWSDLRSEWVVRFDSEDGGSCMEYQDREELCDALWAAVKEVLEERTSLEQSHKDTGKLRRAD